MARPLNPQKLRRLPRVAAVLGLSFAVSVMPAESLGAAPASFKDPHGIACPSAPSGWFIPPGDSTTDQGGGRTIVLPGDVEGNIGGLGTRGGSGVQVTCDYFTQARGHVAVELLYALPTDPNPNNDFYFGCSSGGVKWDDAGRTFRLASPTQFATVAFLDPDRGLSSGDVSAFATVARQLLGNAEGFAHPCALTVQPTASLAQFQFVFKTLAGDRGKGLFYATAGRQSAFSWPVVSETVRDMTLHVQSHGKRYALTIHVRHGITFYPAKPNRKASFKLAVLVKSSKLPSCPRSSTGTLTVSAQPLVLLKVCSQTFQERGDASITQYSR
jgi:hypothetical protein